MERIKKLKYAPYSSAKTIEEYDINDKVIKRKLKSYESIVIIIEYDYKNRNANLIVTGDGIGYGGYVYLPTFYSKTTARHIGAFLKEYTPFRYSQIKEAYYNGEVLTWNI